MLIRNENYCLIIEAEKYRYISLVNAFSLFNKDRCTLQVGCYTMKIKCYIFHAFVSFK